VPVRGAVTCKQCGGSCHHFSEVCKRCREAKPKAPVVSSSTKAHLKPGDKVTWFRNVGRTTWKKVPCTFVKHTARAIVIELEQDGVKIRRALDPDIVDPA